jgi:hypothetical protein
MAVIIGKLTNGFPWHNSKTKVFTVRAIFYKHETFVYGRVKLCLLKGNLLEFVKSCMHSATGDQLFSMGQIQAVPHKFWVDKGTLPKIGKDHPLWSS